LLYHDQDTARNWVKCAWSLYFNRGFTGLPHFPYTLAIVDDYPPYWRYFYLKDRGFPEYKGNRKEKPSVWEEIYKEAINYITHPQCPYHYLRLPSYEADDIASAIVRMSKEFNRDVFLYTIDSDWHGLVDFDLPEPEYANKYISENQEKRKVVWFNMAHWQPRIRGNQQVIEHTLKRMKREISTPAQIWDVKVELGDKSDNLIAGSPLEVISLLELPSEYDLVNNKFSYHLEQLLADNTDHSNLCHLKTAEKWFQHNGFAIPLLDYQKFPV